jgi:predicted nucleotidyltransferase
MLTFEQLQARRDELIALASKHKAENLRVFGSVARGEANEDSDVDLLVHFQQGASLFDLIHLIEDTSALINTKVDVVSDGGLSRYLAKRILAEARPL